MIAGSLMQGPLLPLGLPFLLAGAIKSAYDVTLWRIFRNLPIPDAQLPP